MQEVVDISGEAERHKDEWLLFEVTEVSEIDVPLKGRLLFHGESPDDLHREAMRSRDKDTYAFFAGDIAPPDMVVVL